MPSGPAAFQAYLARRGAHSHSGKNLPNGRPQRIFRRDQARELRVAGTSWRKIAKKLGAPQSTIRGALKP